MVKVINLWFPRNQTKAAEPNDWKRKPMPEKNTRIAFEKEYNEKEMEKINGDLYRNRWRISGLYSGRTINFTFTEAGQIFVFTL